MSKYYKRFFSGPGRHYWGRYGTFCPICWDEYRTLAMASEEMDDFVLKAVDCQECAGTQRDALPWSELCKEARF